MIAQWNIYVIQSRKRMKTNRNFGTSIIRGEREEKEPERKKRKKEHKFT